MVGVGTQTLRDGGEVMIEVRNLVVEFPGPKGAVVQAVSDVSFDVEEGETLGIVASRVVASRRPRKRSSRCPCRRRAMSNTAGSI